MRSIYKQSCRSHGSGTMKACTPRCWMKYTVRCMEATKREPSITNRGRVRGAISFAFAAREDQPSLPELAGMCQASFPGSVRGKRIYMRLFYRELGGYVRFNYAYQQEVAVFMNRMQGRHFPLWRHGYYQRVLRPCSIVMIRRSCSTMSEPGLFSYIRGSHVTQEGGVQMIVVKDIGRFEERRK